MSTFQPPFGSQSLDYAQVDVFAGAALEGNMLGIFPDASGLSTATMQALARETNLSETTFILARNQATERARGVHVRIFTVQEELPFAGHPTLGTASWLYWNHPHLCGAPEITLELQVGPVPVRFRPEDGNPGIFATMRQPDPVFGSFHDPRAVAAALGLDLADLDATYLPQTISTGMPFCVVLLRSMEVAARLRIPPHDSQRYLEANGAKFFYCIASTHAVSPAWHARMQFYGGEDPATGSAAGCAIAYLVHHGLVPSGQEIVLEQGVEMLRPSRLHAAASLVPEAVNGFPITDVFVGGRTIPVASGRFFLPRSESFQQRLEGLPQQRQGVRENGG